MVSTGVMGVIDVKAFATILLTCLVIGKLTAEEELRM